MKLALIFASGYTLVLCLGLQSLSVNQGRQLAAFCTSFAIGLANLFLLKVLPQPTSLAEMAAYLLSGPCAIVTAIRVHPRLVMLFKRQ